MKSDNEYIEKIIKDINYIIEKMEGVDYDSFVLNTILQDAMMFRLIQISESAKLLSDEYKSKSDIPWNSISGLRNRIVHDYGNVDLTVVFDTLIDDIPKVKEGLGC